MTRTLDYFETWLLVSALEFVFSSARLRAPDVITISWIVRLLWEIVFVLGGIIRLIFKNNWYECHKETRKFLRAN